MESHNILSWRVPTGIVKSNLCRKDRPKKIQEEPECVAQTLLELWQLPIPWEACSVPQHSLGDSVYILGK